MTGDCSLGKVTIANDGLTDPDNFWIGAGSSVAPTIQFDVGSQIQYIRAPIFEWYVTTNGTVTLQMTDARTLLPTRLDVGSPTGDIPPVGSVNVSDNYYINGVPLSTGGVTSGTWTPALASGSSTPQAGNVGRWQRVGNLVTVMGVFNHRDFTGSAETEVVFSGLPFTIRSSASSGDSLAQGILTPYNGMQMNQVIGGDGSGDPQTSSAYHQITIVGVEGSTSYKQATYFGTNDIVEQNLLYYSRHKNFSSTVRFAISMTYETSDP